jgi:hypothetical protein
MHRHRRGERFAAIVVPALALILALGWLPVEVQAQQPGGQPAGAPAAGWYQYTPGSGWVLYGPPSAPPGFSSAATPPSPGTPLPPDWLAYSPATGWTNYAPASSPFLPAVAPPRRRVLPMDASRRYAANLVVNGTAPDLIYTLPWYKEYGTGRDIPLSKPWLPPSP